MGTRPGDDEPFANTKAVVATCAVFVPIVAVGAAGAPVNVGDSKGAALAASVPCAAVA